MSNFFNTLAQAILDFVVGMAVYFGLNTILPACNDAIIAAIAVAFAVFFAEKFEVKFKK